MLAQELFLQNQQSILDDYFTFLRFPSIATDPQHLSDVRACASWLKQWMMTCGLQVQSWHEDSIPVLLASDLRAGPHKKTLLLYAHYDVQPVDPLELWTTPPFEPSLREGCIYARGASDDKGQCFYTLCAIRDFLKQHGSLPFNLKFLIEGEEECGSEGLESLLKTHAHHLHAEDLLVVDSSLEAPEQPSITLGARGIISMTVTLTEGAADLHSGRFGGLAINPNKAMVQLLSKLHDATGKVAIEGFYDDVFPPSAEELAALSCEFDLTAFQDAHGFTPHGMEQGTSPLQANWFRPTLEINGISGGYAGPGFKTVIPAVTCAKLSCRLVPQQNPERIVKLLTQFLEKHASAHLKLEIAVHQGTAPGFRRPAHSPLVQLVSQSYSDIFEKPCKKILCGASIPIVPALAQASGAEPVLIGTALSTDRIHAPDEHFSLDSFKKGYLTIYRLLELYKESSS